MAQGWIHTIHSDGAWINEVEGSGPIGRRYDSRQDAVPAGRRHAMAERTDHLIHDLDGTVAEQNSYATGSASPRR